MSSSKNLTSLDVKEKKVSSLKTLNETIKNYGLDVNSLKQSLSDFLNLNETKDIVENHLNVIDEISDRINELNVNEEQKI